MPNTQEEVKRKVIAFNAFYSRLSAVESLQNVNFSTLFGGRSLETSENSSM